MGSSTTSIPAFPNPDPLLGAIYLGGMGAAMLFGATNLQVFFYFQNYKQDELFQKYSVVFLWVVDALHMAIAIVGTWNALIASFGNDTGLTDGISWPTRTQLTLTVILIFSVRSLYTRRAWKLSRDKNRLWPWILIIIHAIGCAGGIVLLIEMYRASQVQLVRWSIDLAFIISTFNDITIAAGICFLLYPETTMLAKTKSMVWTIIRYVIISGALTSACSVVGVITFLVMPDSYIFFGITYVLPKLHVNSYLAMLNGRNGIRYKAEYVEARMSTMSFRRTVGASDGEAGSRVAEATRDKGEVEITVDIVRQQRSHSVS